MVIHIIHTDITKITSWTRKKFLGNFISDATPTAMAIAMTGVKQTQRERGLLPNMKQNPAEDEHDKSLWTGSNMALVRPYWRIDVDMPMDGTHIGDDNTVSCFEQPTNPVTGTQVLRMPCCLTMQFQWMEA